MRRVHRCSENVQENRQHLRHAPHVLHGKQFSGKAQKCSLCTQSVTFLLVPYNGHRNRPDEEPVTTEQFPLNANTAIEKFLGLLSYYREVFSELSDIASLSLKRTACLCRYRKRCHKPRPKICAYTQPASFLWLHAPDTGVELYQARTEAVWNWP